MNGLFKKHGKTAPEAEPQFGLESLEVALSVGDAFQTKIKEVMELQGWRQVTQQSGHYAIPPDAIAEIEKHGAPLYTVQGPWPDFRREYRSRPLAASRGAWLLVGRGAVGSQAIYYQMNALPFWQYSACSITLEFGRRNNKYAFDRYRWHLFDFSSNGEINLPDDAQKITLGEYAEYRVKSLIIGQAGLVSDPKSVQTNIEPGRAYVVVSGQK